jgi:hypothetical protein
MWNVPGPHARGWLVPLTEAASAAILETWSGQPEDIRKALRDALPVEVRSSDPEHREISLHAEAPSILVISQLADPEWQAVLQNRGERRTSEPLPAFRGPDGGAWQAFMIPRAGDWSLSLAYRGRDVFQGLAISGVAWFLFGVVFMRFGRERKGEPA